MAKSLRDIVPLTENDLSGNGPSDSPVGDEHHYAHSLIHDTMRSIHDELSKHLVAMDKIKDPKLYDNHMNHLSDLHDRLEGIHTKIKGLGARVAGGKL